MPKSEWQEGPRDKEWDGARRKKKAISGSYEKSWEELYKILILKLSVFEYPKFWSWICCIPMAETLECEKWVLIICFQPDVLHLTIKLKVCSLTIKGLIFCWILRHNCKTGTISGCLLGAWKDMMPSKELSSDWKLYPPPPRWPGLTNFKIKSRNRLKLVNRFRYIEQRDKWETVLWVRIGEITLKGMNPKDLGQEWERI